MHFVLRRLLNLVSPAERASYPGPLEKMVVRRSKRGALPSYHAPLERPRWVTADRERYTRPDDAVLGLSVADDVPLALPSGGFMKNHHVANLEVGSQPILVTLCEACASASAFVPLVAGKRHRFVVEGTYNTTPILSDFESQSLWAMFTGEALHGPLTGARLERWPLHQCTWREWKTLYPHTLVVNGRGESRRGHGADCINPDSQVTPRVRRKDAPSLRRPSAADDTGARCRVRRARPRHIPWRRFTGSAPCSRTDWVTQRS